MLAPDQTLDPAPSPKAAALANALRIDGWLTPAEASALYDAAHAAEGPIVEIGSWQGRSTAALALGSLDGNGQPVLAIDSFAGVPPLDRVTAQGANPGWKSSTPELLRANLDAAGVNGLVRIIPLPSQQALPQVPESIGVLFVDGGHDYLSARADLESYTPRVAPGGTLIMHDVCESAPGVCRAFDDVIMRQPEHWRVVKRVDSAIVCRRQTTVRRRVMLGFPGRTLTFGVSTRLMQATLGAHDVPIEPSCNGWDDMNILWVAALNAAAAGEITHFAMLHSDVIPDPGWIDTLISELETHGADMISVPNAIKDARGLTSTGIGDPSNHWSALRRFTNKELANLPPTFGLEHTPHRDKYLLHNTGCWVADLRNPKWRTLDSRGELIAYLNFPLRGRVVDGKLIHERESEDWFFSRGMAAIGVRTLVTTKVETIHIGSRGFSNKTDRGQEHDEDTRALWSACETTPHAAGPTEVRERFPAAGGAALESQHVAVQ